jgi:hypothetical protein
MPSGTPASIAVEKPPRLALMQDKRAVLNLMWPRARTTMVEGG